MNKTSPSQNLLSGVFFPPVMSLRVARTLIRGSAVDGDIHW